ACLDAPPHPARRLVRPIDLLRGDLGLPGPAGPREAPVVPTGGPVRGLRRLAMRAGPGTRPGLLAWLPGRDRRADGVAVTEAIGGGAWGHERGTPPVRGGPPGAGSAGAMSDVDH